MTPIVGKRYYIRCGNEVSRARCLAVLPRGTASIMSDEWTKRVVGHDDVLADLPPWYIRLARVFGLGRTAG